MPSKNSKRPDYPYEVASRARRTAVELLQVVIGYLRDPEGADRGIDWSQYVEPAEKTLAELEGLDLPSSWNAVVPRRTLDVFARAADVARSVKSMTRIDEPPNEVRVGALLVQLEAEAVAAGRQPPSDPYLV